MNIITITGPAFTMYYITKCRSVILLPILNLLAILKDLN